MEKQIMEDIIIKPIDPIASAGSVEDNPPKQANPPAQKKIVGPLSQAPLAKKPTIPTRPPVREQIVGPSSRYLSVKKPISKPTLNPTRGIEVDLGEPKKAWARYQSTNSRDAVYFYLEAVFALVRRWQCLQCALKNSRAALRLKPRAPKMKPEPFARVIFCTCDPQVADAKPRSKWSRALRYARKAKASDQRLTDFIKSAGGLNECARRFARDR
jgi:hypothetical protein